MRSLAKTVLAAVASIIMLYGRLDAQTVSTFDVLVATESLTVVTTATVQGNAFSVGGSTLVVAGGNVGVGQSTERNPSSWHWAASRI